MGALTHNGEVLQSLPANASQINFDNTGTNLNSTQTEAAIKEVNTKVNTNANDITQLKSGLIKSLTTTTTITTGSDGTGNSTPIATLHPGKTILGVIVGYNYQTYYGAHHAQNVTYYPPNDYIIIVNDPLVDTEFTVFYTLLYTD